MVKKERQLSLLYCRGKGVKHDMENKQYAGYLDRVSVFLVCETLAEYRVQDRHNVGAIFLVS